jgi:two-component system response regulator PrrA
MPKVLVADDDPDILATLEVRLRANGIQVVTASDCSQAIKLAYAEQPDLILMDIKMPTIGGISAFDSMKLYSRTKNIPVIFITAFPGQEVRERAMELGAADFIAKPFDSEELIAKVKKVLKLDLDV